MNTQQLLLYKQTENDEILNSISFGAESGQSIEHELVWPFLHQLIHTANMYGFAGNLWQTYLTWYLVNHENPYSVGCEISGTVEGTVNEVALHDFELFRKWYHIDFMKSTDQNVKKMFDLCTNYVRIKQKEPILDEGIRTQIEELSYLLAQADNAQEFRDLITGFYKKFGVGKYGLHKAFRVENKDEKVRIVPVTNVLKVHLDDLIGYEIPKKKLENNTKAFVEGRKANNCLLFGDAGTGKSSCVKAILNQYWSQGLRMIELYKHQFRDLSDIISQIKNRNYKYIIYMDDLSFEEFETEYKYLKAIIEGGLEKRPENVLIYATSNRRHLIREKFSDKEGRRDDLHASDTVQEKLSLAARFGESIFFNGPSKKEFQQIVLALAKRNQIRISDETLLLEANKWELAHNGLSGRTAQQFIDYLLSQES